jgi:hypothetical protein
MHISFIRPTQSLPRMPLERAIQLLSFLQPQKVLGSDRQLAVSPRPRVRCSPALLRSFVGESLTAPSKLKHPVSRFDLTPRSNSPSVGSSNVFFCSRKQKDLVFFHSSEIRCRAKNSVKNSSAGLPFPFIPASRSRRTATASMRCFISKSSW